MSSDGKPNPPIPPLRVPESNIFSCIFSSSSVPSFRLSHLIEPKYKIAPLISSVKIFSGNGSNGESVTGSTGTGVGSIAGAGDRIRISLEDVLKVPRTVKVPRMEFPEITLDFTKSINDMIVRKIDDLITHNTHMLMIGASLGAAVSAGVIVGIGMVSINTSSTSSSSSWTMGGFFSKIKSCLRPTFFPGGYRCRYSDSGKDSLREELDSDDEQLHSEEDETSGDVYKENGGYHHHGSQGPQPILSIIQAKPLSTEQTKIPPAEDQCRECLDLITVSLGKRRLLWDDVLKITAFLVIGQCEAAVFREILKEYPICIDENENGSNEKSSKSVSLDERRVCSISVLYVQRLEDEAASVQIEALVQNSKTSTNRIRY
eukprot:CAMPEP_0194112036 /NCGR_PEP_ID=MMETSP0150-20130528/10883_1 /TAXON_ID=122233 /ORGANISM="Chaetoceros debilis, Strain MM31A-1" /LENGTH=373 /DNA_ID=CAMNT_0038801607 /DNA_START=253 /DNA_END=1374 /DNA_ORIENTATION=+